MTSIRNRLVLALVVLAVALLLPVGASADDGGGDVRRSGACTRSSEIMLRLRTDDGSIEVELEIERTPRGSRWTAILVHERRIAFRGSLRARSGGSLRLRRIVPDYFGSDTIVARASGPRGETCRVSATL